MFKLNQITQTFVGFLNDMVDMECSIVMSSRAVYPAQGFCMFHYFKWKVVYFDWVKPLMNSLEVDPQLLKFFCVSLSAVCCLLTISQQMWQRTECE
jgi:hypothetical protein